MAMMDAGVPIKATCAGISVGRFSNDEGKIVHVTDIIGEEAKESLDKIAELKEMIPADAKRKDIQVVGMLLGSPEFQYR